MPFPSPGDLPGLGIEPVSPALTGGFFTTEPPGKPYNGLLLSHKKEWNNTICCNMDGPRDYHTKWGKSHRERQISYDITHVCEF